MRTPAAWVLAWRERPDVGLRYAVYRAKAGSQDFVKLSAEAGPELRFTDTTAVERVPYAYVVRAVNRRGMESAPRDVS